MSTKHFTVTFSVDEDGIVDNVRVNGKRRRIEQNDRPSEEVVWPIYRTNDRFKGEELFPGVHIDLIASPSG